MMQPVIARLKQQGHYQCRVISLCSFRGFPSPSDRFPLADDFISIPDRQIRPSPTAGKQGGRASHRLRGVAREVSWQLMLQRPLRHTLQTRPDLVVLPNDAAFPYDHIMKMLHGRDIPFLLMQEGIRFPLPTDKEHDAYGRGGAAAIAAWGENSAAYFRQVGVPAERIYVTGNPRFDFVRQTEWQTMAAQLTSQLPLGQTNLLFLSNPIDDQGFCTTAEKMALVHCFITEITPLFENPEFRLLIKLHGRESLADFTGVCAPFPFAAQILILQNEPLYPLFKLADAAIVLASTVGLEALLFGLPLGVLEIPGTGFVFDYVSSDVAQGLTWTQPMAAQIHSLLTPQPERVIATEKYVYCNLASVGNATQQVVSLIKQLV